MTMKEIPQTSNTGCVLGGFGAMGCGLLIFIPLVLFGSGWFILFHTPLPFNWLAKLINKDENIQVGKVSGSLSKGFRIAKIEFSEKVNEVSEMEDVRILYPDLLKSLNKNEFNIKEIGVSRARLYVDSISTDGEKYIDEHLGDQTVADEIKNSSDDMETLNRFHIGRIDIQNVELLDPAREFQFKLNECTIDGLEIIEKRIRMGQLTIRSSILDFSLSPLQTNENGNVLSSNHRLKAVLQPNESLKVRKAINLHGTVELTNIEYPKVNLTAFDGKLRISSTDVTGQTRLQTNGLTLADYLELDVILPTQLNWDATMHDEKGDSGKMESSSGSFILGKTEFSIMMGKNPSPQQVIFATSSGDDSNYTFVLESAEGEEFPVVRVHSKANPKWPDREILSEITFEKPFHNLKENEQQLIRKTLGEEPGLTVQ